MEHPRPLKIVVASDLYRPSRGGTETTTANLALALSQQGHEVMVVAPGQKLRETYFEAKVHPQTLRVRSFPFPAGPDMRLSWRPYRHLKPYLDTFKPDIIQVNNHYDLGKALIRYGRKRGVPVVGGSHFMPESLLFDIRRYRRIYNRLRMAGWRWEARVYNRATAVVGPTKTAVNYLIAAGLKVPTHVISNGIDLVANHPIDVSTTTMRKKMKLPERPTVIYIGRLSAEKELGVLIEATAQASSDVDLQLVLVGAGLAEKELKAQAKRLGVSDRVIFTGYLERPAQKIDYLAASDVFAIASPVELQSIVTLEAMACGLPVVAVNEGALPELVRPGHDGELFADLDSAALTHCLIKVLTNPELLKKYRQGSLAIVKQHNINDLPVNYERFYREILAKGL